MKIDVIAFGAHPDDVELSVGGTLLSMAAKGYSTAIVDMTRGELGTRGTPQIRASEAEAAAALLKVTQRRNLMIPDGHVNLSDITRAAVIGVIREWKPTLILAPLEHDLHPDHAWTGRIITEAAFLAGIKRYPVDGEPHRPRTTLRYASHSLMEPNLVVDITEHFEQKRTACLAYKSQFHDPDSKEPQTYISGKSFWDWWEARARSYGHRIGVAYGEGLLHDGPLPVPDPVQLFRGYGYYP
jgi:bacillithiol biosynthesis deacetylase BshB1